MNVVFKPPSLWCFVIAAQIDYFCFIDYAKTFDCVDHNKLWKILKEMQISDHLTYLLGICMEVKKQKLERDMEQQTGSK